MKRKPWNEEIFQEDDLCLPKEAHNQDNFKTAGHLESGLNKGRFSLGELGKNFFKTPQDSLKLWKIPELDEDKNENYRMLSEEIEKNILGEGQRFSSLEKTEQKDLLRYTHDVLLWSAKYMWEKYDLGLPITLYKTLDETQNSWGSLMKFIQLAQKYSKNPSSGFLVCQLLKISKRFHEVSSFACIDDIKEETQWLGGYLAKNISGIEKIPEFWSADGLEKITGMDSQETDPEKSANEKKKKMIRVEKMKTSSTKKRNEKKSKGRALSVSFVDETGKGHGFRILAAYFNTKTIDRIVGKGLRKPDLPIEEILNDGARGRILVRPEKMSEAVLWLKTLGFNSKDSRNGVSQRSEVVMCAQKLSDGSVAPAYTEEGEMIPLGKGSTAFEIQIISAGDFEKSETGEQNQKIFSGVQTTQELMTNGSISDIRMKRIKKRAYEKALHVFPESPVSFDTIDKRFAKEFFQDRITKRWYSYEQLMGAGLTDIFPKEERIKLLINNIQDETFSDPLLNNVSPYQWQKLFETKELPNDIPLPIQKEIVSFVSLKQFGKVFREKIKKQLEVRQVIEE